MKNKLILILFLALSFPMPQLVHANSSSATEAKFKNADTVVKKLVDIRAAVNNFYDKNTAWPSSLAVLNSSGFYSGDFKTTFNGTIVGSVSGSEYQLTVNVLDEKVAAYVARMVAGSNSDSVVNMPIPRPVTQAINNTFISRFFDPARPDLNEMSTNLSLGGNNINNINTANTLVLNANDLNVAQKAIIATADIANANLTIATVDQAVIANSTLNNTNIESGQAKQLVVANSLHSKSNTVIDGSLQVNASAEFLNNTNFTKPVTFKDIAGSNAVITTLTVENGQAKQLTVNDLNSTTANTDKLLANSVNSKTISNTGSLTNQGSATINGGLAVAGGANLDSVTVSGKAQSASSVTGELVVGGGSDLKGNVTARGKVQTQSGISNAGGLTTDTLAVTGESVTSGLANNGTFTNTGDAVITGKATIKSSLVTQSGIKNIGGVKTDTLDVSGASKSGTLIVEGATELQGPVLIKDQLTSNSGIVNSGGLSTDILNVSGKSQLNGQLTTNNGIANTGGLRTDTANIDGLIESGALKVNRTADFLGSVTFEDTFLAKGKVTFQSGLANTGGLSTDSLNVAGASSVNTLTAQGASKFKSTVDVSGKLTTANGIDNRGGLVTDTINVLNTLVVDGAGNFKDEVLFDGPLKINRKISVTGGNNQNLNITNDFDSLSIGIKKDSVEFVSNSNKFIFNNDVSAQGFYDTDSGTYLDSGVLNLAGAPTSAIEIRSSGGKSKIDFSNDLGTDFDARLELTSNDQLSVVGADFFANKILANTVVADGYYVNDTRNIASKPSDYKRQVSFEFKNRGVIGAPGNSTYSGVTTFAPWSDSSGGHNYQTSYSTKNNIASLAIRSGFSTGNWSSWSQVFTDNYHPNADRLTTARSISLSGDMIGSVMFDGSSNVTINAIHQMDASDLNLGNLKNYGISNRFDWNNPNSYASSQAVYSGHQDILTKLNSYYTSAQVDSNFFNRTQSDARYYNIGEVTKATVELDKVKNYGISNRFDWNNPNSYASSQAVYAGHQDILTKLNSYYTSAQVDSNFFNRTQSDARYYNIGEVTKATVQLDKVNNFGITDNYNLKSSETYASAKSVSDLRDYVARDYLDYNTGDERYYVIGTIDKGTVGLSNLKNYSISNSYSLNSPTSYASSKAVHDLNSVIQNKFKSYFTSWQSDARYYNIGQVTKATVNLDKLSNYGISDRYTLNSSQSYASSKAVSDSYNSLLNKLDGYYSKAQSEARYYNVGEVTKATVGLDKLNNFGISDRYDWDNSNSYASSKALFRLKTYVDNNKGHSLKVHDTRDATTRPIDYKKEVRFEFKRRSVMGVTGDSFFSGVRTFAPWNDSSGGSAYQTAYTTKGGLPVVSIRTGSLSSSNWGGWLRILDESYANQLFYRKSEIDQNFFTRTQSDDRYYKKGDVTKATVGLSNLKNYGISNSYTLNSSTSYASSKAVNDLKSYVDTVARQGLRVHDTRDVISKPTDFNNEVKYEFKRRSTIGAPGDSYWSGVRTFAPWSETSGGHAYQTVFSTKNGLPVMAMRSGDLSSSSWGQWTRILDENTANELYYKKDQNLVIYNSSPVVQIRSWSSTSPILRLTRYSTSADIEFDGSNINLNDDVKVKNSLTVGSTISGSDITARGTLRADNQLIVKNGATIGGGISLGGNLTRSSKYTIGVTSDNRIHWAPYQNGAYQWGREFGYNPSINSWYSETSFRAAGLQIHSSKWVLKAVPNNIEAYYDGALAWQVASNKIIHHKQTEFKTDARFKTNATIDNLLTTKKLIVSEDAEVRGNLYVDGDVNISGWGSLKTKFAQLEEDSTKADNEPFYRYVGLFYTTTQKSVCPDKANANLSRKFHIDLRNHKESDKIAVNVKYTGNIKNKTYSSNRSSSIESGYFYVWNKTKSNTRTVSRYRVVLDDTNVAIRPYSSFFSLDGGSEYRIDYRIEVDNDENYCEKVLASWGGGVEFMFSKTPASTSITNS